MDIGEGWFVDEADPTVGQFTDYVYHDCERWDEEAERPAEVVHDVTITPSAVLGVVDVTDIYTCACGATKVMTIQEPADDFEEPRHEEVDYNEWEER